MLYPPRGLLVCLALVSLTKAISINASRKEALLSAIPKSVGERWSDVVGKFTDDQISAFYGALCNEGKCNGAAIAFLLNYCDEIAPKITPEEDGGNGKWATCARYGDTWFFEHVRERFPELPGDFTYPPYDMDKKFVLDALGEWYKSVAHYSVASSEKNLDQALLFVHITDPDPCVKRKVIKARILCYLGEIDSEALRTYWTEQSQNAISAVFHNAMRGKDHILPIIQPKLFTKAPCLKDRNCTYQNYMAELQDVIDEPFAKYLQSIDAVKLVNIMKQLKGPEVEDRIYEESVILHRLYEAAYGSDFHGEPPRKTRQGDYLIIDSAKSSWNEFERQLCAIDPTYVDQTFALNPFWIQRLEPHIRKKAESPTDIKATMDKVKILREILIQTQGIMGWKEEFFDERFFSLFPDSIWVLYDIFEKYPRYLGFFFDIMIPDWLTNGEEDRLIEKLLEDVRDKAMSESEIDQVIADIMRQWYSNHPLFEEKFSGALDIMQGHLYKAFHRQYYPNLDSVIMSIKAQDDQVALKELQAAMVGSKFYQSLPEHLRAKFKNEPDLSKYESWQLQVLWEHPDLLPLMYHLEMPLQEVIRKGDKVPSLAQILLHFYEQHHQKTHFGEILKGVVRRSSKSGSEINWGGARATSQLGDNFDFSDEPERRWKEFEEELYKLDQQEGERFQKVRDFAPNHIKLSEEKINPEDYSNYTDLFDAMVKAARRN
jgi:hypothetical protein